MYTLNNQLINLHITSSYIYCPTIIEYNYVMVTIYNFKINDF